MKVGTLSSNVTVTNRPMRRGVERLGDEWGQYDTYNSA